MRERSSNHQAMSRRSLILAAKLFVAAALFFLIYQMIDIGQLLAILESANVFLVATSFGLLLARLPVMGLRWGLILGEQEYALSTLFLTKLSLVSMFFSLFLPTSSGGDVVRGVYLTRRNVAVRDAVVSVLVDRLAGVIMLIALAIPPAVFLVIWWPQHWQLSAAVAVLVLLAVMMILFFRRMAMVDTAPPLGSAWPGRLLYTIRVVAAETGTLVRNRALGLRVLALTLVLQIVGILSVYLVGEALGGQVSFLFYLVLVPIIWLITMLPVSIGGLGVRELAFVALFTQVGMEAELAFAISLVVFALALGQSIIGGVVFAIDRLGATPIEEKQKL